MLMAEGVEQVDRARAAADRRKVIGQGRARTHPRLRVGADRQAECVGMGVEPAPFARIWRIVGAAELDKTRRAQPAAEARHDQRTILEHDRGQRSEENTSELQSLMRHSYAAFCWKKKKKQNTNKQQKQ